MKIVTVTQGVKRRCGYVAIVKIKIRTTRKEGALHELSEAEMMQMDEEEIIEHKKAQRGEERRILRERDSVQYHEVKKGTGGS